MAPSSSLARLLALAGLLPAGAAVSSASCDGLASCSPKECVMTSEADCSLTGPAVDHAAAIAGLPCKACTQSTADVCSDTGASFLTAGGHVKAAWCNEDFLVVAADGKPQYDAAVPLAGIPLPPGGGTNCRVRSVSEQLNVYKIPLKPVKLAEGQSNTLVNSIPGVPGAPPGASAVAVDGVPIFPNYNNRGMPTWVSCEVDYCNAHAGRGLDYHYHGDPFGSRCLYSASNYSGAAAHPPLIGFSFDGYKIFGRYTATSQEGQPVSLDSCGGHSHTTLGYHYHPQVSQGTTTELDGVQNPGTVTFTKYDGSPMECYGGDVSKIPNFFEASGRQINYDSTKGDLCSRNDLENIKPCCGMTKFYAAPGISPNTVASDGSCVGGQSSSSGAAAGTSGGSSGSAGQCASGTCSGTDDKGKACPATFSERPCPRGCTSTCDGAATSPTPAPPTSPTPTPPNGATPAPTAPGTGNAEQCASGTCSGTDDKGKACPATFSERPCPRGCTSTCNGAAASPTPAATPTPAPATPRAAPTPTPAPASTSTAPGGNQVASGAASPVLAGGTLLIVAAASLTKL